MLWPQQRLSQLQGSQDQGAYPASAAYFTRLDIVTIQVNFCYLHLTSRLQCDEGRPTCGRCAKSKKICLGYDRAAGVAFRDETRAMEKRAGKGDRRKSVPQKSPIDSTTSTLGSLRLNEASGPAAPSPRDSEWTAPTASFGFAGAESYHPLDVPPDTPYRASTVSSNFLGYDQIDLIPSIEVGAAVIPPRDIVPLNLPQDPVQQSICFFMSKFVQDSRSEEIWGGSLEALPSIYNEVGAFSALSLATAATSMSSVAWTPECAHFRSMSLQKYVKSLKLLNDAVQDPRESKSDGVLMAVLMLRFYEVRYDRHDHGLRSTTRLANLLVEYQVLDIAEIRPRISHEGCCSAHQGPSTKLVS